MLGKPPIGTSSGTSRGKSLGTSPGTSRGTPADAPMVASRGVPTATPAVVPTDAPADPPAAAPAQAPLRQRAGTGAPRPARRMAAAQAAAFLRALAAANPIPRTALTYADPFTLLVAVVLSAQSTDAGVNRATPALFAVAPDPARMAALGAAGIAPYIRTIGLWQAKARHLAALSQQLLDRHAGRVPEDRAGLEALPGVGRKTANVVLNVAFGAETLAVDTHVFRVGNRTGLAPGRTPRAVEDGLVRRCPPELLRDAHHWLILHGRHICQARRPLCGHCPAFEPCNHRRKHAEREATADVTPDSARRNPA